MRNLASFDLADCLQLIRSENVGPVTFFKLIQRFGNPQSALRALPDLAKKGGMKRKFQLASRQKIEKEIELTHRFGAQFIRIGEADYPKFLQHIHTPPPILIMRGHAHLWQAPKLCLGIVGSRNASAAGANFAKQIAQKCGQRGITIISGLARGIDAQAHQGSLATGTVGVIAGGIDTLYPPENKMLYEAMAESGAIVTEQAFGITPQAKNFPARNRIIAGICTALMVAEAAPRSGSLITAKYALEEGREVLAVPGSPMDPRSAGGNGLIKQGATLIESVEDIITAMNRPLELAESHSNSFAFAAKSAAELQEAEIDKARVEITSLLSPVAVEIDEIARQTSIPMAVLQQVLLELELAGRLHRSYGGRVAILDVTDDSFIQQIL